MVPEGKWLQGAVGEKWIHCGTWEATGAAFKPRVGKGGMGRDVGGGIHRGWKAVDEGWKAGHTGGVRTQQGNEFIGERMRLRDADFPTENGERALLKGILEEHQLEQ